MALAESHTTEIADAIASCAGSWAIIRKGMEQAAPRCRRWGGTAQQAEARARAAWKRLDVRQGWALLVDPQGRVIARQSGPWAVRTRW